LLCGGFTFLADFAMEYFRFTNHKSGSDYVRELCNAKAPAMGFDNTTAGIEISD